jgi:transposase
MPRKRKRKIGRPKKPGPKPRKEATRTCLSNDESFRELLVRDIYATGGHLSQTAWRLQISRPLIYILVNKWKLWSHVNESRRRRFENRPLAKSHEQELIELAKLNLRG